MSDECRARNSSRRTQGNAEVLRRSFCHTGGELRVARRNPNSEGPNLGPFVMPPSLMMADVSIPLSNGRPAEGPGVQSFTARSTVAGRDAGGTLDALQYRGIQSPALLSSFCQDCLHLLDGLLYVLDVLGFRLKFHVALQMRQGFGAFAAVQ